MNNGGNGGCQWQRDTDIFLNQEYELKCKKELLLWKNIFSENRIDIF